MRSKIPAIVKKSSLVLCIDAGFASTVLSSYVILTHNSVINNLLEPAFARQKAVQEYIIVYE